MSMPDIDGMLIEALALTQLLAGKSRNDAGDICCCVCSSTTSLVCVGKGWGGVYACRACSSQTEPS